jgi:hypothetical protein
MDGPNNKPEEQEGRIEAHSSEVGLITTEMLEKRAREIAVIDGRTEEDVTEDDRRRARKELLDEGFTLSSQDIESDLAAPSASGDMAADTGHRVPEDKPLDEQSLAEEETREGVREADHDRMLRSRRDEGPQE